MFVVSFSCWSRQSYGEKLMGKMSSEFRGKTLLDGHRSYEDSGINDLVVVGGYQKDKLSNSSYTLLDNPD